MIKIVEALPYEDLPKRIKEIEEEDRIVRIMEEMSKIPNKEQIGVRLPGERCKYEE